MNNLLAALSTVPNNRNPNANPKTFGENNPQQSSPLSDSGKLALWLWLGT